VPLLDECDAITDVMLCVTSIKYVYNARMSVRIGTRHLRALIPRRAVSNLVPLAGDILTQNFQ